MKTIINKIKIADSDSRREILEMFNGEFVAKQIKILKIKKGNVLGNHYHPYRENCYVLSGKIIFYFEGIKTKEKNFFAMEEGDMILMDPYYAHTIESLEDSILIEGTEEEYNPKMDYSYKLK